jgi:hypothetical protein
LSIPIRALEREVENYPAAQRLKTQPRSGPGLSRVRTELFQLLVIVERVKAGMRRAKLEGRQIGRARLDVDRVQVVIDRRCGLSLTVVAKRHSISRASVCRLMKEATANSHAAGVLVSNGYLAAHSAKGDR